MNRMHHGMNANPHRGFTLVELMVAMTIGLLIGLVVFAAYSSGLNTQRAQTDLTRLEESARFGFDLVSRAVRRAGFRNVLTVYPAAYVGQTAKQFCASGPVGSAFSATNDAATVDLGGGVTANVLNNSDTITVRYYGQDNAAHTAADGVVLDCLGNAVRRGTLVQDTIYVAADPTNDNEPTLFCSTDNPAIPVGAPRNLALVPGVETLQMLYAEDRDDDTVANRYVPANKIGNPGRDGNFDDVRGVLVSLIVRTKNATGTDRSARTLRHFSDDYSPSAMEDTAGGDFTTPTDGRTRIHFANYAAARNFPVCK